MIINEVNNTKVHKLQFHQVPLEAGSKKETVPIGCHVKTGPVSTLHLQLSWRGLCQAAGGVIEDLFTVHVLL